MSCFPSAVFDFIFLTYDYTASIVWVESIPSVKLQSSDLGYKTSPEPPFKLPSSLPFHSAPFPSFLPSFILFF